MITFTGVAWASLALAAGVWEITTPAGRDFAAVDMAPGTAHVRSRDAKQ
jgi:hypothetical protein